MLNQSPPKRIITSLFYLVCDGNVHNFFRMASAKAKLGDDWKYEIYFDPEADKDRGPSHHITDDDLIDKLSNLVDVDEKIDRVTVYKLPLSEWQITDFFLYHNFVLFETRKWWWTIEKNSQGITIQRSKHEGAVKDRYRQERRNSGIKNEESDEGRKSVGQLIRWLYRENELNKEYNVYTSNCQHFAKAVFNYVAKNKNM